jgi:hypothetical protein
MRRLRLWIERWQRWKKLSLREKQKSKPSLKGYKEKYRLLSQRSISGEAGITTGFNPAEQSEWARLKSRKTEKFVRALHAQELVESRFAPQMAESIMRRG